MILLTLSSGAVILLALSQKTKVGICNPFSNGVKTPIHGVFYCPQKITTDLVRLIVMVARSGQPLKRLAGSIARYCKPATRRRPMICNVWRRFIHFKQWSSAMCHYAQSAPKLRFIPRQSLFNLVKRTAHGQQMIGTDLTFEQVSGLLAEYPTLIVKFSRIEVRNGR
jgi:hypothetical protein